MNEELIKCGLVMPVAAIDGCDESHWADVKKIVTDAVKANGFEAMLIGDSLESNVIHNDIVQKLYNDEVVVCDISCRNPNVMFKLGMRLAFDKPTVIIQDNETPFAFDAGNVETLTYSRNLGFSDILDFQKELAEKVEIAYFKAKESQDASFLSLFEGVKAKGYESVEKKGIGLILSEIKKLNESMDAFKTSPGKETESNVVKAEVAEPKATPMMNASVQWGDDMIPASDMIEEFITNYHQSYDGPSMDSGLGGRIRLRDIMFSYFKQRYDAKMANHLIKDLRIVDNVYQRLKTTSQPSVVESIES